MWRDVGVHALYLSVLAGLVLWVLWTSGVLPRLVSN